MIATLDVEWPTEWVKPPEAVPLDAIDLGSMHGFWDQPDRRSCSPITRIRAVGEPDRLLSPVSHGIKRLDCEFTALTRQRRVPLRAVTIGAL